MKTKLQIIEETAAFYMEDPSRRAHNGEGCDYWMKDGRMCAVGRYLIDPKMTPFGDIGGLFCQRKITQEDFIESVRGHSPSFWVRLQSFHDHSGYWDTNGLTSDGKECLNFLKEEYAAD